MEGHLNCSLFYLSVLQDLRLLPLYAILSIVPPEVCSAGAENPDLTGISQKSVCACVCACVSVSEGKALCTRLYVNIWRVGGCSRRNGVHVHGRAHATVVDCVKVD